MCQPAAYSRATTTTKWYVNEEQHAQRVDMLPLLALNISGLVSYVVIVFQFTHPFADFNVNISKCG